MPDRTRGIAPKSAESGVGLECRVRAFVPYCAQCLPPSFVVRIKESIHLFRRRQLMGIKHHISRATAVAASLSLMFVAAPAQAADTAILDIGQGTLVADGTLVQVPVTFTCPTTTDNQPVLNLGLTQRIGVKSAFGGRGEVGFACTGEPQTIVITASVSRRSEVPYFRVGKATANAILNTCPADGSECTTVDRTQEIKFKL